jgi:hypothetical protein
MDHESLTIDQQADRLWHIWGPEAFAIVQRRIEAARDRIGLEEALYWLDVETRLYTLSMGLRAA